MKHMKKLVSVLLTMVMVFAMTAVASADTVDNKTDHSYAAYQIFAGTQTDDEDKGSLAVTGWGTGINGDTFLDALQKDDTLGTAFAECENAAAVATVLSTYSDKSPEANAFAALAYQHKTTTYTTIDSKANNVTLDKGYYLIVDTTETSDTNDAKNLALLQVTGKGSITIENKTDIPTVTKKVWEESLDNGNGKYNDVADYDIGDDVPFQLTGTMPSNIASYDSYKYIFHDKMDTSLSFNNDITVKIDGKIVDPSCYDIVTDVSDECTFEVVFENILAAKERESNNDISITKDSIVTVDFTAKLTTSAQIGLPGQENKVMLEYSNDVNVGGSGETGKTPWDTVIVFTYELDITKTNADGTVKLGGAKFQIIKDGQYAIVTDGKVSGWTTDSENANTILISDENSGLIQISGLDEGTYTLHEKEAPDGYVVAADKTLVITASTDEVQNYKETEESDEPGEILTSLKLKVDNDNEIEGTVADGKVSTTITNTKGGALPETGGMGTTIFYVLGSILVLGAAVLLITRKRMGAQR